MMQGVLRALLAIVWIGSTVGLSAQQTFSGVISDSTCGGSHLTIAGPAKMTDRGARASDLEGDR